MFDLPTNPEPLRTPDPVSLGDIGLQWLPIVGRERRPIGIQLRLRPNGDLPAHAALADVLDCVLAGFVAEGATPFPHGLVVLAPSGFGSADALLGWTAPRNVLLQVDAAELDGDAPCRRLLDIQRQGIRLALRVAGSVPPPAEKLRLFQYLLMDQAPQTPATVPWLAVDPPSYSASCAAIEAGAHGLVGWPMAGDPAIQGRGLKPMHRTVLGLIRLVQADADLKDIEKAFKADPVLAYMMLTLANCPALSNGTSVGSLSQAVMILGYSRLLKWLVLLLVIANKDLQAMPLVFLTVTRGFAVEALESAAGVSRARQDEAFVVGALSLLDRITGLTLPDLLKQVALPEDVQAALLHGAGPHGAYLECVCRFEGNGGLGRERMGNAAAAPHDPALSQWPGNLAPSAVNQALLQALASADAILTAV